MLIREGVLVVEGGAWMLGLPVIETYLCSAELLYFVGTNRTQCYTDIIQITYTAEVMLATLCLENNAMFQNHLRRLVDASKFLILRDKRRTLWKTLANTSVVLGGYKNDNSKCLWRIFLTVIYSGSQSIILTTY